MNLLVFEIRGQFAHFKKYYATTSALTYAFPPKTSLYGFIGAVLGLSKAENAYLRSFGGKDCLIGLQVINPIKTVRLGINLRPNRDRYKDNPKPTLIEFVRDPHYRVFFYHHDEVLQTNLRRALESHSSVFTPSLGLANLMADFEWIGESTATQMSSGLPVDINSIIPRSQFKTFGEMKEADIIEQSMFAIEMDSERNVTERDDIVFDRNGNLIHAIVSHYYKTDDYGNIALF